MLTVILVALVIGAIDPAVVAIVAAVGAPLFAYLAAARRFSGRIESSDASELWAESRAIRDWSQERIADLQNHVEKLERRVKELEGTNDHLIAENARLLQETSRLYQENASLKAHGGVD